MNQVGRYAFAALLVLLETAVFLALGRLLDLDRAPFLLFTPSVLLAAMLGGRDAGLLATLLGVLAAEVVFREEARSRWETLELVRMALFAVSGAGISILSGHLQQARARAEERAEAAREAGRGAGRRAGHRRAARPRRRTAGRGARHALRRVAGGTGARRRSGVPRHRRQPHAGRPSRPGASGNASLSAPLSEQPPVPRDHVRRHAADARRPAAADGRRARRQPVVDAEFAAVRDDGRVVMMQAHAVPLLDETRRGARRARRLHRRLGAAAQRRGTTLPRRGVAAAEQLARLRRDAAPRGRAGRAGDGRLVGARRGRRRGPADARRLGAPRRRRAGLARGGSPRCAPAARMRRRSRSRPSASRRSMRHVDDDVLRVARRGAVADRQARGRSA